MLRIQAVKHRRRWIVALATSALLLAVGGLCSSRREPATTLVAREGVPWFVAESASVEYRFGSAVLPSAYLVLAGVREWDPSVDPKPGTTLVYTPDETVKFYWSESLKLHGYRAPEWFPLGHRPPFRCVNIDLGGRAVVTIDRRFFFVEVSAEAGAYPAPR